MRHKDDGDDLLKTIEMPSAVNFDATNDLLALLADVDDFLKSADVASALEEKGVNSSIALLASQGLAAYIRGDKEQAASDFQAVSEEIRDRLQLSAQLRKRR